MSKRIILPPGEETSMLLDGNFETNTYSINLKFSFFQALAMKTKLPDDIIFMPGMYGKKYRFFYMPNMRM